MGYAELLIDSGDLVVDTEPLINVLKYMLTEKVVQNDLIDVDLVYAEEQANENDPAIFSDEQEAVETMDLSSEPNQEDDDIEIERYRNE